MVREVAGSGFELYEANQSYRADLTEHEQDPVDSAHNRVAAREVTETMLSFYALEHNAYARLGPEEGRNFVTWWIQELRTAAIQLGTMYINAWRSHLWS